MTKQEVREIARRLAVPVADKPESQEICFVPAGGYVRFIESYLQEQGSELSGEQRAPVALHHEHHGSGLAPLPLGAGLDHGEG